MPTVSCKNRVGPNVFTRMRTPVFLLACSLLFTHTVHAETARLPVLYPFVQGGKWGYIDAQGAWVIEPRFDRCIQLFEGERVRAWQGKRWLLIDRTGKEITQGSFTEPILGLDDALFEVVSNGKKQGILAHSGKVILPAIYDDVLLSKDRAWVRQSGKLGIFALNGRWIMKPSLPWPKNREMPSVTDDGVAWFKQGKRWGLLSAEGKQLFPARFTEHVMGRKEAEDWSHPEGLDFKHGRAWVTDGKDYLLIASDGRVLARQPFRSVQEWTDDLTVFHTATRYTDKDRVGLISCEGEIVLPAQYTDIKPLHEGRAVIVQREDQHGDNGQTVSNRTYGYIDALGRVVVEPGAFYGPGVRDGGQGELTPFSEGLAPVWNNGKESQRTHTHDPFAGYIDPSGAIVIAEQFYATRPFSEDLGAVLERRPQGAGFSPAPGRWGFVDKSGTMVINPQFTGVAPFCRGRAWVTKSLDRGEHSWAMIDREGNVLTAFSFVPPEEKNGWPHPEGERLPPVRWRGDLAVVTESEFHNGLATVEGKVIIPPLYNRIGEFHDGMAVAVESRPAGGGDINWVTSLISDKGETLVTGVYTAISDFEGGFAWASHRWTDHRGPYQHEGWGLIDTAAHEQTELKYVRVWWVRDKQEVYIDSSCPRYTGELAPVALAEGYQQYGKEGDPEVWERNGWGYVNRVGKIVAWHDKSEGK